MYAYAVGNTIIVLKVLKAYGYKRMEDLDGKS
jgi:hypothetical protein